MADAGFAALAKVRRAVLELHQLPAKTARRSCNRLVEIVGAQIAAQTDAYGRAWARHSAATVKRWGSHPILDLTGALKDVKAVPMAGAGISVTLGAPYAAFHQLGSRHMPARPILPTAGLPAKWRAALDATSGALFREALR